ncbi:MAG: Gfo/Idh/MocA family oxidoreductase [Kiritimatiellaeota bacterium]|nr:Gfo/Idh/MocA family oxidoreductase [Kiritimatiellota bacterium]
MSTPLRVAVVGLGTMGTKYAELLRDDKIAGATLAAVCNRRPEPRAAYPDARGFADIQALLKARATDAVIIATPHYAHTTIAIAALRRGLHVLVDKPIAVHKADAEKMLAAHRGKKSVFAIMFQMRTDPRFRKIKALLADGALGKIQRMQWTLTDWFRTDTYYRAGQWRATWAGEGGGILLNQAPHQLDLLQWLLGQPERVRAWCHLGKYHKIEVEDEVTAYLEFPGGATGVFIASTGEAPGTNRLEIACDRARLVLEGQRLTVDTNRIPAAELRATSPEMFAVSQTTREEFHFEVPIEPHRTVVQNFVSAIRDCAPLIAPAEEGMRSLELANAMLLSSMTDQAVELPISARRYATLLKKLIAASAH